MRREPPGAAPAQWGEAADPEPQLGQGGESGCGCHL
jgi:hypothetical protein